MHVLVIGGTRFIGYHTTWRLLAAGHRVTLFNRGTLGNPFGSRVERLEGDRTTDDFRRLLGERSFDAAVDFAAYYGDEVRSVLDVLAGRVGHYVFISTGQVYLVRDGCAWPAREEDYAGRLIPKPESSADRSEWEYGVGKRECEDLLVEAWISSRFPSTRLRLPMVNGERDHLRRIERYLWRILDGGPVILPDGGTRPTRHVYSGAVARAIVSLLGQERTFGQAYNLSQDEMPTVAQLAGTLIELLGSPARVLGVPAERIREAGLDPKDLSPFGGRWASLLEPARAKAELGFRHEPLREYLGTIIACFLAHPPSAPSESYSRHRAAERALAALAAPA
jgi:nucleoside-diphosphate-sugar epimerase